MEGLLFIIAEWGPSPSSRDAASSSEYISSFRAIDIQGQNIYSFSACKKQNRNTACVEATKK